ncbi:MAG: hypothetical protein HYV97_01925 [Bdellovibrio sp.]|nr:hypothetical protein [Bdellovibrio sp.]
MKTISIFLLTFLISSCSLFKREVDWVRYKSDVGFHFTKIREATLGRVLIRHSFFKETRTYLRYINEETSQFKQQWPIVPNEWQEQFMLKVQQASLDQDVSKSGESLSGEKFVADINRALLKYIEQLRSLANPKARDERPRSLFFFF